MLNLNQLRAFYQVAQCQSYSLAAQELFVTQPAVNAQVKLFEESCGLKLLIAKGRRVHLSEEGKILFEVVRKMFEAEQKIENTLEELRELKQGTLRLGTARTYARHFVPRLVGTFRRSYPQINIDLQEGSSLDLVHSLLTLKTDLAVLSQTDEDPQIAFIPFRQEEVVLILPLQHPLARKKIIAISELAGEPIIMKEKGSGTRKIVDKLLAENRIIPHILMESSDAEMIKLLIQHGEGISFLVRPVVEKEIKEKKIVTGRLQAAPLQLEVGVALMKKTPLSPATRAFLEIIRELMKDQRPPADIRELNKVLQEGQKEIGIR